MLSLEVYSIRKRSRRFKARADAKLLLNALCLIALICMPTALADEAEYQKIRLQMTSSLH